MLTGLVSNTASSVVSTDNYSSPHNGPQALGNLTVASGGVGVVFIGADFKNGGQLPTTWANATRDATPESSDGNFTIAGAHVGGAGTYAITATSAASGSGDWNFNGMIGAAWA